MTRTGAASETAARSRRTPRPGPRADIRWRRRPWSRPRLRAYNSTPIATASTSASTMTTTSTIDSGSRKDLLPFFVGAESGCGPPAGGGPGGGPGGGGGAEYPGGGPCGGPCGYCGGPAGTAAGPAGTAAAWAAGPAAGYGGPTGLSPPRFCLTARVDLCGCSLPRWSRAPSGRFRGRCRSRAVGGRPLLM